MKLLKKVLIYLMMILIFALTFSQEENRITIFQNKNEPAKLKIGVTKLKTKELPMDFSVEKKVIYGELPQSVGENHLIFVSETLNEMPSLSTTNGRKSINNIKRYLTKDIKESAKFTYRVVEGKKEEGQEESKKYLVINCKTQISGVYIYVVEKGSYHVKEVYKGKFNIAETLIDENYLGQEKFGILTFNKGHNLTDGKWVSSTDGTNITVDNTPIDKNIAFITGENGFPKKFKTEKGQGFHRSKVKITLGTGSYGETIEDKNGFSFTAGIYDITMPLRLDKTKGKRESIRFQTIEDSEYVKIQLQDWDGKSAIDTSIKVEYMGRSAGGSYEVARTENYRLVIEPRENGYEDSNSEIKINRDRSFTPSGETLSYDGFSPYFNENRADYITVVDYPKKWAEVPEGSYLQIIQNEAFVQDDITLSEGGQFTSREIPLMRDRINSQQMGTVQIIADNDEYLKFIIKINRDLKFRDSTSNNFELRYVKENGTNNEILKVDKIFLSIDPQKEEELEETRGGVFIYDSANSNTAIFSADSNGNLTTRGTSFNLNQVSQIGDLPKKVVFDKDKNDWGEAQKIVVTNESIKSVSDDGASTSDQFWTTDGNFTFYESDKEGDIILSTDGDHSDTLGKYAEFGIRTNNSNYLEFSIFHYNDTGKNGNKFLSAVFKIEYIAVIDSQEVVKKTDSLRIIIQPRAEGENTPTITIKSPPVWYDSSLGSGIGNANHYREVELVGNIATTYNRGEQIFTKNNGWLEARNIPEYNYQYRHKIEINGGNGEVVKTTDDEGKTLSSTFVNIGNGNQVMFAFDGYDDNSLSFGLSKYNYDGGKGRVFITQYNKEGIIDKVQEYNIDIERFDPLPYVDNNINSSMPITTTKEYTKFYEFDQPTETNPVTIEYGEVGLADLDTRITNEFGGEGIEIRATRDILLIGEGEFSNYKIPAKFYFEKQPRIEERNSNGDVYSILKGENEKAIQGKLYVYIPSQEYLIPKAKFKLVKASDDRKSPLEVGVVVNGNETKYFEEITDLYLDLTSQRFVKTELIFENTHIQQEASPDSDKGSMYWIKLGTDFPNGQIKELEGSDITWGRVMGEVIDTPIDKINSKFSKLTAELYDENYDKVGEVTEVMDNIISRKIAGNNFEFRLSNNKKYIEFRVNNEVVNGQAQEYKIGDGAFYLRFSLENSKGEKKYLFTQKYEVRFEEIPGIFGKVEVKFKNPMLYFEGQEGTGIESSKLEGRILVDKTNNASGYSPIGNHTTEQDAQDWWEVNKAVDYPDINSYDYKFYSDPNFTQELNTNQATGISYNGILFGFTRENSNNFSSLVVGIGKNYSFEESPREVAIYVKWFDKKTGKEYRKDTVRVTVENFDPKYYGKVYPAREPDNTGRNNHEVINDVGSGYEELKKDSEVSTYYIDLDTIYREYQRYAGVLNLIHDNYLSSFTTKPLENLVAIPTTAGLPTINGRVVFKEIKDEIETNSTQTQDSYLTEIIPTFTDKIDDALKTPKKYKLYFEVSAEEYKKLYGRTKYEIKTRAREDITNDKDIIQIGFTEISGHFYDNLKLNTALNFTTSASPFVITTNDLDFGTINVLFNSGKDIKKYADTEIFLSGENITNVSLTLEGNTPDVDGTYKTVISQYNENGEIEGGNILNVTGIKLDLIVDKSKEGEETQTKTFKLGGNLTVPIGSKVGTYHGVIYINSTFID